MLSTIRFRRKELLFGETSLRQGSRFMSGIYMESDLEKNKSKDIGAPTLRRWRGIDFHEASLRASAAFFPLPSSPRV